MILKSPEPTLLRSVFFFFFLNFIPLNLICQIQILSLAYSLEQALRQLQNSDQSIDSGN